jgi:methylenetetrahydrofolate reductase (NADPH)
LGKFVNAPSSDPSELLRDLVAGITADPDCLIQQFHLYPLGGLKRSAEWMYKIQDGHFEISGKGFTTI